MSHIGRLFEKTRREAGLKPKDVVLRAGYVKISKGMRHLQTLEQGQDLLPNLRLVEKFAVAIGISDADLTAAFALDWQELNRPITPSLVERLMPAVYRRHELPEDCTEDDARKIAAKLSVETGRNFCLVLSRVRSVYFYPSGKTSESSYVPGTSIGRYKAFMAMAKAKVQGGSCLG